MPPASRPTSGTIPPSLLERVRANDGRARERLTRPCAPLVYAWVRRGGVPEADAPDVTQDVFLELARSLARFRRDQPGDTFTGWVRTIARRRAADHARARTTLAVGGSDARRELEQLPVPPELSGPPESDPDRAEVLRRGLELVRGAVAEKTWKAFEATSVHGRPPADVAAELGMTVGAVWVAKSRVLKRLRDELDGIV